MSVPTFVDLQGFIIGGNFVVKEVAVLRNGNILSHYIFGPCVPWYSLNKAERRRAFWLMANHHGEKHPRYSENDYSRRVDTTMSVPTFADLQGFIIGGNFVAKEFAVLRNGYILSHCIFGPCVPWYGLTKAERRHASWLMTNNHELQWDDGTVPYNRVKDLITKTVTDEASYTVVYVKGREKREWLRNLLLDDDDIYIETVDTHYADVPSLNKLDVTHTLRCNKHVTNCALQNVFKLFNWWFYHTK
ncbi:hypothetical protein X777_05475 [Ooceraea biroi]|uniref:Uncharacterized protein n=1 Tax=Ooceraea biroi TaxID=2015173 RepID=A0A026WIK6_OOCBI|nr:hypothetical protein X777_05475 [Ooceraea biroi]